MSLFGKVHDTKIKIFTDIGQEGHYDLDGFDRDSFYSPENYKAPIVKRPTEQPLPISPKMDNGITEKDRKKISDELGHLLADSYTLYLRTHNFHWNVTGPMFQTLHLLFEQQYNELALAVDTIAERIRALGFRAPATYSEFISLSSLPVESGTPSAEQMIQQLYLGQECVIKQARKMLPLTESHHDVVTTDLLTQRMQVHEKNSWILRSLLKDSPQSPNVPM